MRRITYSTLRQAWERVRTEVSLLAKQAKKLWKRGRRVIEGPGSTEGPLRFVKSYGALRKDAKSLVDNAIREATELDSDSENDGFAWRVTPLFADMISSVAVDSHKVPLRRAEAVALASNTTIRAFDNGLRQQLSVRRNRRNSSRFNNRVAVIEVVSQSVGLSRDELDAELKRERVEEESFGAGRQQLDTLHDEITSRLAESDEVAENIHEALSDLEDLWETIASRMVKGTRGLQAANGLTSLYREHLGLAIEPP